MGATTHNNYQQLPAGPVDWVAVYNDLVGKLEKGHTVKMTAAVNLVQADPFYIDSNGKAAKATNATAYTGLWQSASTLAGAIGYGQHSGIFAKTGWAWTKGELIYVNSQGALTQTKDDNVVGVALSATEILLFNPDLKRILAAAIDERSADLVFIPEYPGAVMVASGSNNDPGTLGMTSDSEVISNVRRNYYDWRSSIGSGLQSYDVVIQIPIPYDFTGFRAGTNTALTLEIKTEENTITNNKLDVTINRNGQAASSSLTDQKSSAAATWETIGFDETNTVLAAVVAGDILNVSIRMYSQNSKYVRIGKITLQTKLR